MLNVSRWLVRKSVARSRSWRGLWQAGTDLMLPAICPGCQLHELDVRRIPLCAVCTAALVQPVDWLCRRCGAFSHPYAQQDGKCGHCRHLRHAFQAAVALGLYEGELRRAIVRMKRSTEQSLTYGIGQLLADRATALLS